jgi:hypothetical protein
MRADARQLLEDYVTLGKLMQLATLGRDGSPILCNVWYDPHFAPDLLRFISRPDRQHSINLRTDPRIAGSIVAVPLDSLGQKVRGVTFTGAARELDRVGIEDEIRQFIGRWPAATINAESLARDATASRLYEIAVDEWILFDEVNFPDNPRQRVDACRRQPPSKDQ